jgi:DNA-binding response OmpR family regulator
MEGSMSGKRLLLVEDERSLRQCLAEFLSDHGFDVVEAEDGDHAVAMLDNIDLLITDIDMPGSLDGNAIAARAKALHPGLPVIYASGRPECVSNEIELNDIVLAKPAGPAKLTAAVVCLLRGTEVGPLGGVKGH